MAVVILQRESCSDNPVLLLPQPYCSCLGGARCSSVVRTFAHGAMGRRIDSSLGGPIELFLVPTSVSRLWYMQSCLWDGAYKRTLAVNRK